MDKAYWDGRDWMLASSPDTLAITTPDGLKLKGYYFSPSDSAANLAFIVHGYRIDAPVNGLLAKWFYDNGFNVFLPDQRSHGQSEGKWIGMGFLEKNDMAQWLDTLVQKGNSQIILHGTSMGAATVMFMASMQLPTQVKCIVEDCGYTSVYEQSAYQMKQMFHLPPFPVLTIAAWENRFFAGFNLNDASVLNSVEKSNCPIFFIHGAEDTLVPTEMVYRLYETANCEKEIWVVPGAGHAMSIYTMPVEYRQRLKTFYEKYLN